MTDSSEQGAASDKASGAKPSAEEIEIRKSEARLKKRREAYARAQAMTDVLLDELGAKRLIVIDDEALTPDLYLGAFAANPEALDVLADAELDPIESPEDWDQDVRQKWSALSTDRKRELRTAAAALLAELSEWSPSALEALEGMFSAGRLALVTPEEWNEQQTELLGDGQAVVLFDQELGGDDSGLVLLERYLEPARVAGEPLPAAGILSQEVSEEGELRVAAKEQVPAGELVLISKNHLQNGDLRRAVQLFRLTANLSRLIAARDAVLEGIQHDLEMALEGTREIRPRVIEDLVYRSSRTEGAWEGETYARLVRLLMIEAARERELEDTTSRDVVAEARRFTRFIDEAHENSSRQANHFRAVENYVPGDWVNALRLPLVNGDLFRWTNYLGQVTIGILICQPCDLVLRPEGDRDAREARLLPIVETGKNSKEKLLEFILPATSGNPLPEYGRVVLKDGFYVDLSVLDLCWTNCRGEARLENVDAEFHDVPLTDGMRHRRDQLRGAAAEALSFLKAVGKDEQAMALRLQRHGDLDLQYDVSAPRRWVYPIGRIGRVAERQAAAVLVRYAGVQARTAFEHDLAKFGEGYDFSGPTDTVGS